MTVRLGLSHHLIMRPLNPNGTYACEVIRASAGSKMAQVGNAVTRPSQPIEGKCKPKKRPAHAGLFISNESRLFQRVPESFGSGEFAELKVSEGAFLQRRISLNGT